MVLSCRPWSYLHPEKSHGFEEERPSGVAAPVATKGHRQCEVAASGLNHKGSKELVFFTPDNVKDPRL